MFKKTLKIPMIAAASLVCIFIVAFAVYLLAHIQGEAESFEINRPELEPKVLIATQGSDFKNSLVANLCQQLGERQFYLKIIDISALAAVNEDDWDGVVLLHTTEAWKLPPDVRNYLERAQDLNKVVPVTTSGTGRWKTKEFKIDSITSASRKSEISALTTEIINRLDFILKTRGEAHYPHDL